MALPRPALRRAVKVRASAAFCLAGAVVGTGLYFGNLAYVRADDAAAKAAAAARAAAAAAQSASTVTLSAAAAGSPKATLVQGLFERYFDGLNTHDYAEYASTLDAAMRARNTNSAFKAGYAKTTDSSETIDSIGRSGSGLVAVVTFISRQPPVDSPDNSACNDYTLTLPLVPQGSGYVITTPAAGYATYSDC